MISAISATGIIRVSNPEAAKFLQGQFTCDIREINDQQSRLGAYCNPKGKVLVICRIFNVAGNYYLSFPKSMLELTYNTLKKYAAFSKIALEDISHIWSGMGLFAENADDMPETMRSFLINLKVDEVITMNEVTFIRVPDAHFRYEIYGPTAKITELKALTKNALSLDEKNWRLLNIQANIPTIYPETSNQFTPHMLSLPGLNAVSFNKGCYLGQEIIARTEHLGKAKRHLQRITLSEPHNPGDKLYRNSEVIGTIIESAPINKEKILALAVVSD